MAIVEKKEEKKAVSYLGPDALRWMASNGLDYRAIFSAAKKHEDKAGEYEKVLRRKSLKACGKELDGYLQEFRAAENELRKLASLLSDPDFKRRFLSENKDYSEARYDAIVANVRKKASYCQNMAWAYEERYAQKYGARQEYQTHLLVREMARSIREEMEKSAAKPSAPPAYRRAPERAQLAQNYRVEPVSRETHALVSSFMQDMQRKYGEKAPAKEEVRVASEEPPRYRRGFERTGLSWENYAALRREEIPPYHRGERRIRSSEPVVVARRSVPAKTEEELSSGEARISKAPSSVAEAQSKIDRVKKERERVKVSLSSLSGNEKKEAAARLEQLNRQLYRLRRIRDSLMRA